MTQIRFAYRMTHIDNIKNIMQVGIVTASSPNANPDFVQIGDVTAIETRKKKRLKDGSDLGDYVPFYFGPRTPMLYVIQKGYNGVQKRKAEEIVYCVIDINDLVRDGVECVFTDGHALDNFTIEYPGTRLCEVNSLLDYNILYAKQWGDLDDVRRRKQAELLLKKALPVQYLKYFLVYNDWARRKLLEDGVPVKMVIIPQNLDLFYY
ncbi:MAG: DUF4433 domain-containing protein [Bacteroidales bacterium]|nr:DUF4433 domain-containing protein [Bacteroidales bacterium]